MASASRRMGLAGRLGRWPTVEELAEASGLHKEDIYATMELARTGEPRSLDERLNPGDDGGGETLLELVGHEDSEYDLSLDRLALADALDTLPLRERTIITLRFYQGMTQRRVADRIQISQMHVSRLERRALLKLRQFIQRGQTATRALDVDPGPTPSGLPVAS